MRNMVFSSWELCRAAWKFMETTQLTEKFLKFDETNKKKLNIVSVMNISTEHYGILMV